MIIQESDISVHLTSFRKGNFSFLFFSFYSGEENKENPETEIRKTSIKCHVYLYLWFNKGFT